MHIAEPNKTDLNNDDVGSFCISFFQMYINKNTAGRKAAININIIYIVLSFYDVKSQFLNQLYGVERHDTIILFLTIRQ